MPEYARVCQSMPKLCLFGDYGNDVNKGDDDDDGDNYDDNVDGDDDDQDDREGQTPHLVA